MISHRIVLGLATATTAVSAAQAAPPRSNDGCIRIAKPSPGRLLAQSRAGPIPLQPGVTAVALAVACDDGRDLPLAQWVMDAPPRRRFLLVLEDLRADAQPGVLFDLHLGAERIGVLNFYAAQKPGVAARPRMVSYDVSRTLRTLAASGRLGGALVLMIAPQGASSPGSGAAIGRVALMEQ